jgi:hypothetical protein
MSLVQYRNWPCSLTYDSSLFVEFEDIEDKELLLEDLRRGKGIKSSG